MACSVLTQQLLSNALLLLLLLLYCSLPVMQQAPFIHNSQLVPTQGGCASQNCPITHPDKAICLQGRPRHVEILCS